MIKLKTVDPRLCHDVWYLENIDIQRMHLCTYTKPGEGACYVRIHIDSIYFDVDFDFDLIYRKTIPGRFRRTACFAFRSTSTYWNS